MIELPEAVVLAEQAARTLSGKRIASAVAGQSPHKFAWYTGDPAEYNSRLAGKTVGQATASGGNVEIRADEMTLVISTPLRYHAAGEKRPAKHQLLLEFADGTALSATVQMWGVLLCVGDGEPVGLRDYAIAKARPSPLSAAFDRAYFDSLRAGSEALSAKAFLATEQRIPGLGNGVLQDILWTARIHPKRKMGELGDEEFGRMFDTVKTVLAAMAAQGGRDTERDLFGRPGGYRTVLSKNTVGTPCPACGTEIRKEAYLGGAIYYCGGCQRV
ncbi:MAG TPA: endonuclease VIII [Anaerolineae bacterium]|nr:endonuclease VIII [Anaerolineae bacterium]HPL30722.1 endonuclease VIII [Anaerolineae bacterium]